MNSAQKISRTRSAARKHASGILIFSLALAAALVTIPAKAQVFQELYAFTGGADGGSPQGALIQARDGNFYGTTYDGGSYRFGTVFKITPDGALTTVVSLDWTNGQHPVGALVQASDGNFYGTTIDPLIFRVTPDGTLTAMAWLDGDFAGELVQASSGYLYGATTYGGQQQEGSLFRMFPGQPHSFEEIFAFDDQHPQQYGFLPSGGLIQASDGGLYGVTDEGGTNWYGTAFRVTPSGTLTTLGSFPTGPGARFPYGQMLQATDGSFYGAASGGSQGRIFKLATNGALSTFAWFNGANGENPNGGLIEAPDGNLYGTATSWGTNYDCECGTVFKLTGGGTLTALVSFSGQSGPFPGATPYAGLTLGRDGNLYGTTGTQGSSGNGNVFRIVMPGPTLTLSSQPSTPNQLTLSWRTNYSGFALQSSASLNPPTWIDCTNPVAISNGQYIVTNAISAGAQFFRLRK
jgi:uncharacterized repeat protein (TIGR03803 family)